MPTNASVYFISTCTAHGWNAVYYLHPHRRNISYLVTAFSDTPASLRCFNAFSTSPHFCTCGVFHSIRRVVAIGSFRIRLKDKPSLASVCLSSPDGGGYSARCRKKEFTLL